jgi:hypothetical protein
MRVLCVPEGGANTRQIFSSLCPASATKIFSGNGMCSVVAQAATHKSAGTTSAAIA